MIRENVEFIGVDPYHFCETGEVVCTVTANVGQSTAIGPKVAIRRKRPFLNLKDVIGTIDASIYSKNNFQDNSKYIIRKKERTVMQSPIECFKEIIGKRKDAIDIIATSETCLRIVEDGIMTISEAITALSDLREQISGGNLKVKESINEAVKVGREVVKETYGSIAEAIRDINKDAPHQQDQLNCQYDAARTLAASTHGAASHLTKTCIETEDEDGNEMCIVRRLTPTETSRLQGFPDDYTKIDGPETADSPQFKAHGNSWATPCANFISTRIEMELKRMNHDGSVRYATCCSGIEAQSVSVKNLDWKSLFFSEIEPFPCRVLAKHYPDTPNLGDMTQIHYDSEKGVITNEPMEKDYTLDSCFTRAPIIELPFKEGELDVFSGGTPCQSVSVAGKREGMAEGSGTRSSLAFHFQRIIDELKPTFTIWENVPGAFSSNGGADFIWFVNKCAESGYQMAWRVLDAQYVMTEEFPRAVPQRRRRIWLVGYRGSDWRVPARVCFENKDELTELPPERIPEMGFKTVNKDCEFTIVRDFGSDEQGNDGLMGLVMESDDGRRDLLKVSRMIDFKDIPEETDFSKVPMATIYEFAKKVGNPLYIGDVFRKDKKRQAITVDSTVDLFSMLDDGGENKAKEDEKVEENTEWVGAEKITPAILENIGNAGILANGRICTMSCPEWTSGIQLSPQKYNAWEEVVRHKEWLKANGLLPEAYNETVCGLSDVLQEDPDEKYNLSWRACFGILRRAEARAKELPPALHIALISTIRENAGIVKWYALNGRDTKKKETDVSEREAAMICFDKYISSKVSFDDVVPEEPKKSTSEDEDADDEELNVADGGDIVDFDGDEMEDDE